MLNVISLPEIENAVDFVCEASIYDGVHTGRFSSGSAPTMSSEVYDGVHTGRFSSGSAPVASTVITQGERTGAFSSGS